MNQWILTIEQLPIKIYKLVHNLTKEQLDTRYREDGQTIRQVIHYLADSHQQSYTQFKWALTEDTPVIKAYYEERWAELEDGKYDFIIPSLNVITALQTKWVYFLKTLFSEHLAIVFVYPDGKEKISLTKNIGIYAWHREHHFEHINQLLIKIDWK